MTPGLVAQGIRSHSPEVAVSTFGVEMSMLTFRKDAVFWRSDADLRQRIQCQQDQRLKGCEGVAEVHQRGDKNKDIEHEGPDIAQRH